MVELLDLVLFEGTKEDFPDSGLWEYGGIIYNWDLEVFIPSYSHLSLLDESCIMDLGAVYTATITPV